MSVRLEGRMPQLVLASASRARAHMLEQAGVPVSVQPAGIDEDAIREALAGEGADTQPGDVAMILAQAKAMAVSEQRPGDLVIGADQVLVCDGKRYDKPHSMAQARAQLISLRGRTHVLISAVACARGAEVVWSHDDTAHLTMRDFTNDFIGTYLADIRADALTSVGSYRLEGTGVQLFEAVDGDFFTILGLPMLALLAFLRAQGMLAQ
jgi:septum formation protein